LPGALQRVASRPGCAETPRNNDLIDEPSLVMRKQGDEMKLDCESGREGGTRFLLRTLNQSEVWFINVMWKTARTASPDAWR
jgi:hypothetical protein